ncbi:MAG: APC family permease [Oligoflexales bacterium]|nr:APC family permease [Oligoflexales bacterium]
MGTRTDKSVSPAGKVGLVVAVAVGLNAMIGAGIVAIPAFLSHEAGPAGTISFILSILIVLCMGLSLATLEILHPTEAWSYTYPSSWGGHRLGILSSSFYLIGVTVAMGFLVQQAGVWFQHLIPMEDQRLLGLLVFAALVLLVLAGAVISSWGQYLIAIVVVGSLLATSSVCFSHWDSKLLSPFAPHGLSGILAATPKAMFSLLGFESVVSLFSIVKDPHKNVPKACVLSVLVVGGLYLIFASSVLVSIPPFFFEKGAEETLSSVLGRAFPEHVYLSFFLWLGGLFGILGTLHSMIWSSGLLFVNVLRKVRAKPFCSFFKKNLPHEKMCLLLSSALIATVALNLSSSLILDLAVFLIAAAQVLSIMALLFERSLWRTGRNFLTLMAIAGGAVFMYYSLKPWF